MRIDHLIGSGKIGVSASRTSLSFLDWASADDSLTAGKERFNEADLAEKPEFSCKYTDLELSKDDLKDVYSKGKPS